jgi:penicillin-binding protein 1A
MPENDPPFDGRSNPNRDRPSRRSPPHWSRWPLRIVAWLLGLAAAAAVAVGLVAAVALAAAYPNLPDTSTLADYRPKLPLRVFSADGTLIGEFGEEHRTLTPIGQIPEVIKNAVLAAEDARFYKHGGIDFKGLIRASLADLRHIKKRQGASTISMQVARNVYLSSERTYTRKIYEVLLAFKLEHALTKDQILEIYLNQIYLGNRVYGFAAASEVYFGKPLKDLTIAEAAMLAGLPKAPGTNNPLINPARARDRQLYVINRMQETGFITAEQADAARKEQLHLRDAASPRPHAEYVAEMVRQFMFAQYGESTYTRGLDVYTTLVSADQRTAYTALRKGIMDYERRQVYRGPEEFIALPSDPQERDDAIDRALADHPDNGDLLSAVVLSASPKEVTAMPSNGTPIHITGAGLRPAQTGLSARAQPHVKIIPGAIIRVILTPQNTWEIAQLPEVEGAFIAMDPNSGAIKALIGGFDFDKSKFNHVTQAWRQPGSSFKPFIYSAALEKGFAPATVVNDAPLFFDASTTGSQPWEPKNYGGGFEGPMTLRRALAKSKNLVAIRVLQAISPQYAQDWIAQFGFDRNKQPPVLPMALGAGSVTPMQMAVGYSVFANGGYRITPYLIARITDAKGNVLVDKPPQPLEKMPRAISARNAYIMNSLLQEVTRSGTGARAQATLKRPDIYGKTGTTNDSMDAWFCGFQPSIVGIAWMGYDTPHSLGSHATGADVTLPAWISFMQRALQGVPVAPLNPPPGVVNIDGEWYFDDFTPGRDVAALGLDSTVPGDTAPPRSPPPRSASRSSTCFATELRKAPLTERAFPLRSPFS